ncbi:MAG TPA: LL-diaminopimelate aminotransferase [Armatimonadota bacterium]|nr:LL-diaminopimelate aminotransferase [Armatimonadota bacterium]
MEIKRADRVASLPPYPFAELARLKQQALADGVHLLDFGIGDPDQPTPAPIIDALCAAARDPETHRYDESTYGPPEFLSAVASWFQSRFGVRLDTDGQIKLTIGAKEALAHLVWAYVDPGDLVLVPDPRYAVYSVSTKFAGGSIYEMPLLESNGFLVDYDAIPGDVADRAKMLFINYPHNPTGACADLAFFRRTIEFAKEHSVIVCHDAAYSEVYFEGRKAPSILQVDGAMDCAIEIHSLSKTYNMTGWRLGFAVGCSELVGGLTKLKSNVDSNAFPAVARAGAAALSGPQDSVDRMRALIQQRRDWLVDGLRSLGWPVRKPDGTFYIWAPVARGYTSADFAALLLRDAGMLVTPGSAYGSHGEGYIRLSLTIQADDVQRYIAEAVERVGRLGLRWD